MNNLEDLYTKAFSSPGMFYIVPIRAEMITTANTFLYSNTTNYRRLMVVNPKFTAGNNELLEALEDITLDEVNDQILKRRAMYDRFYRESARPWYKRLFNLE